MDEILVRLQAAIYAIPPASRSARATAQARLNGLLGSGCDVVPTSGTSDTPSTQNAADDSDVENSERGRGDQDAEASAAPLAPVARASVGLPGSDLRTKQRRLSRTLLRAAAAAVVVAATGAVVWARLGTPARTRAGAPSTSSSQPGGSLPPAGLPGATRLASLHTVSCPTVTECIAVGRDKTRHGDLAMVLVWTRGKWTVESSTPHQRSVSLSGVACPSPVFCVAVGSRLTSGSPGDQPLIETWDGKTWMISKVPVPQNASNPGLIAVSCASPTFCVAVGKAGGAFALIERWNGTSWVLDYSPFPSGTNLGNFSLSAVSCPSSTFCLTVGSYAPSRGGAQTAIVEAWDGSRWNLEVSPDYAATLLEGVSCVSSQFCVISGEETNFQSSRDPRIGDGAVVEEWNGSKLIVQRTPRFAPGGSLLGARLQAVWCTSGQSCVAVGDYSVSRNSTREKLDLTLAESWNGSKWVVVPTPNSPSKVTSVSGLSCPSATLCIAIGTWTANGGRPHTFAESWNGTTWTIQPTP